MGRVGNKGSDINWDVSPVSSPATVLTHCGEVNKSQSQVKVCLHTCAKLRNHKVSISQSVSTFSCISTGSITQYLFCPSRILQETLITSSVSLEQEFSVNSSGLLRESSCLPFNCQVPLSNNSQNVLH